jgi:hypothetical protein
LAGFSLPPEQFRNWCRSKRQAFSWFSPKENHSSRSLSDHSNCETALKALLQTEVTFQSPKTANWPRAVNAGSDTLRDFGQKTRILCNFIKLSPPASPARFGDRAAWVPQLCSKDPNFMQFYEKTPAPGEQTGQLP